MLPTFMDMTKALVILLAIAIILGIAAFFTVFSPGTYVMSGSSNPNGNSGSLSFGGLANSNGSGAPTTTTSTTATSTQFIPGQNGGFATSFSYPYVMNWNEGSNSFSITGARLTGNKLTVALKIQIGNVGSCLPINIRLVSDESGGVTAPSQTNFIFPDSNSCNATPNKTYDNQLLDFTVPPLTPTPFLFTTGGASNQFFQIATTTDGGLQIQLPATNG